MVSLLLCRVLKTTMCGPWTLVMRLGRSRKKSTHNKSYVSHMYHAFDKKTSHKMLRKFLARQSWPSVTKKKKTKMTLAKSSSILVERRRQTTHHAPNNSRQTALSPTRDWCNVGNLAESRLGEFTLTPMRLSRGTKACIPKSPKSCSLLLLLPPLPVALSLIT